MIRQRLLKKVAASRRLPWLCDQILRRHFWTIERGHAAGLRIKISHNFDYIDGCSELPVQQAINETLRPGGTFVDIGANLGFFSLLAARSVGKAGHVHAFEALSENAELVAENAARNGFTNTSVIAKAVGGENGTADLVLADWLGGASIAHGSSAEARTAKTRRVEVVRLDDILGSQDLPSPMVVKIDVEGAERDVISGMSKTIARCHPVLIYEIDDGDKQRFTERWRALDRFVEELGYSVTHLANSYENLHWHVGHSLASPRD